MWSRIAALTVLAAVAAFGAGCAEDTISRPRADAGSAGQDGSLDDPLALTEGMRLEYRAILTRRGEGAADEQNSQYTITLTIDSVDDQGSRGESTLQITASNWTTTADDWMAPYDYDSWVGRLGPSLRDDQVSDTAATAHLSQVPVIPPAPTQSAPKMLPSVDTFFVDMRRIDALRSGFASTYSDKMPQVADPAANQGKWRFTFKGMFPASGANDAVVYYRVKTREVSLTYHPTGFLTRIDESIGDTAMRPSASCRIELISGP